MEKRFIIYDNKKGTNNICITDYKDTLTTYTKKEARKRVNYLNKAAEQFGWTERYFYIEVELE